jgi:hypothetical protein
MLSLGTLLSIAIRPAVSTGKESCLGDTQQESQGLEAHRGTDEHHGRRNEAPADHDRGNPKACADSMQNKVAWYLEQAVADEKHAGAKAESGRTEFQIGIHVQRSEADIDPVEPCGDIEYKQERYQAARDVSERHDSQDLSIIRS